MQDSYGYYIMIDIYQNSSQSAAARVLNNRRWSKIFLYLIKLQ